jgi:outer membrane protein assembly factor BamB
MSLIDWAPLVRRVRLRSWQRTFGCGSVYRSARSVVLLSLVALMTSAGFLASLVPLAAPASATAPAVVPVVDTEVTTAGGYVSLSGIGDASHPDPALVLDTRLGVGAPRATVAAGGTVRLQVSGRGGVPASGVAAVALNVSVMDPTAMGYLTVYPDGVTRPAVSNINFGTVQAAPGQVITPVGAGGKVDLYNGSAGTVQLVADVTGYYLSGTPTAAGAFGSLAPSRLLDTRSGVGALKAASIAAGGTVHLQVTGRGGVPVSGVAGVALNVTVTAATRTGFVTVSASGSVRPVVSNLNFVAGQTVANLVIVRVGTGGRVDLYNGSGGTVQLIADVSGYYLSGTPTVAGAFGSLVPSRLLDTRIGLGAPKVAVAAGGIGKFQVTGRGGVPLSNVSAVVLNVTVTATARDGSVGVYGDGTREPTLPTLNFFEGQTLAGLVIVQVGADGKVDLENHSGGAIQLIADVSGYYLSGAVTVPGVYSSLTAFQLLDTRFGVGAPKGAVVGGGTVYLQVTGRGGVPVSGVSGVVLNVTARAPMAAGRVIVYADGTSRPSVSNLNFVAGQSVTRLLIAPVGVDGKVDLYNDSAGTVQLSADVVGYFGGIRTHPSITTLQSSSAASAYDTALTLTASVTGAPGTPVGDVRFTDASNGSVLANEPLVGGVAHLVTAALAPGTRNMVATYLGDNRTDPSVSTSRAITVTPPETTAATAFQNNSRHDGMDLGDTFNPATLHQAWSVNLKPASGTGAVSYPLIAGGRIFVMVAKVDSSWAFHDLVAFDAATGVIDWRVNWQMGSDAGIPVGITYDGGQLFAQTDAGQLTAYDAATGNINWTIAADNDSISSPLTAYDGVLYSSAGTSRLFASSEANGEVLWSAQVWDGVMSSPAVDDSGVYVDYACDFSYRFLLNGKMRWTDIFGCNGFGGATSVLNGGNLYLPGGNGPPGALIIATATGEISGTFGGTGMPSFDAANRYEVVDGVLNAVDKSGSPARWSFTGDGAIDTTPVTTNGIVFTGSSNGNLYGINSSTGAQEWTAVAPGPVSTVDGMVGSGPGIHIGLAAADGLLAVPAGGYLTVYKN